MMGPTGPRIDAERESRGMNIVEAFFEDYVVGSSRETSGRTVTEADIVLHAGQTGDFFPQGERAFPVDDPESREIGDERRIDGLDERGLDLIHSQAPEIHFRSCDDFRQPQLGSTVFALVPPTDRLCRLSPGHRIDIGNRDLDPHTACLQDRPVPSQLYDDSFESERPGSDPKTGLGHSPVGGLLFALARRGR